MRLRSLSAIVVIPLAVTSLAACGSSSPADPLAAAKTYAKTSPATIDQSARDALTALKSVHINAKITGSGTATATDPVAMDMSLDTLGNCTGSMTTSGFTFDILGASGTYYFKAGAAFWTSQGAPASILGKVADKWVTGSSASQMSSACDLGSLTKEFTSSPVSGDHPKVVGTAIVDGVAVVNLQVSDTQGELNTLSIAGAAPHNVIQVVSSNGKNKMAFTAINQPVTTTAPAGAVNTDTLK